MEDVISDQATQKLFIKWVRDQGVSTGGIGPVRLASRGIGIVARRNIRAGEELVNVPESALLTEDSPPISFKDRFGSISVHGLLAAFLAFGNSEELNRYRAWRATWPSIDAFKKSMPILWPQNLRTCRQAGSDTIPRSFSPMPPAIGGLWASLSLSSNQRQAAKGLLQLQEERLKKDWNAVVHVFRHADQEAYTYSWLVVNTRSFYYEMPRLKEPRARADRMALCPFVDFFNHADEGCDVTFDEKGFIVTSDRDYEEGEELFVSYGSHSNDFLLTEYGFILSKNKWDSLPLEDIVLASIDIGSQKRLQSAGYLGNYTLNSDGVCHRTQVAIRTKTLTRQDWRLFIQGREVELGPRKDESKADFAICQYILHDYYREARNSLMCLEDDSLMSFEFADEIKKTLVERWTQISLLVKGAFINGINPYTQIAFKNTHTGIDDLI